MAKVRSNRVAAVKDAPGTASENSTFSLTPEEMAGTLAFMEERETMLEVFRKSLDFISIAEVYWAMCREFGENSAQAVIARGKLFIAINTCHKEGLKKRLIEVRDKLDRAEAVYARALAKADKQRGVKA